jgi:hypothetical protein
MLAKGFAAVSDKNAAIQNKAWQQGKLFVTSMGSQMPESSSRYTKFQNLAFLDFDDDLSKSRLRCGCRINDSSESMSESKHDEPVNKIVRIGIRLPSGIARVLVDSIDRGDLNHLGIVTASIHPDKMTLPSKWIAKIQNETQIVGDDFSK